MSLAVKRFRLLLQASEVLLMNSGFVYMLCNDGGNVLYTGSTGDLKSRINHHKKRYIPGFTKKYNVDKLIYFEKHTNVDEAKAREKQIKGYSRAKKEALIASRNPTWRELPSDLLE
jgi:putative endonuclease